MVGALAHLACSSESPAPAPSASGVFATNVLRGKNFLKPGQVVLTFDDGPSTFTRGLARYLENKNIPAVYFMVHHNRDKRDFTIFLDEPTGQHTAKDVCALKGQTVASHGDKHTMRANNPSDLHDVTLALSNLCPRPYYFMRFPGGIWNSSDKSALNSTPIPELGINYGEIYIGAVNWDVTGEDWSSGCQSDVNRCRDSYIKKTVGNDKDRCKGGIILLHDIYPSTMELVLGSGWQRMLEDPTLPLADDSMLKRLQRASCEIVSLDTSDNIEALLGTSDVPIEGSAKAKSASSRLKSKDVLSIALTDSQKCDIPIGASFRYERRPQSTVGTYIRAVLTELPQNLKCSGEFQVGKTVYFQPDEFAITSNRK